MKVAVRAFFATLSLCAITHAGAAITLYEHEGFRGRAVTINSNVLNLKQMGFNDMASSALVEGGQWTVCENDNYTGRCITLRPGSYVSLQQLGMQDSITSVRPYRRGQPSYDSPDPQGAPNYGYYRRPREQVFSANVVAVRAVMGAGEQRCWVERQQVGGSDANVGGAVLGAIIGGVLGHQVGGGRGRDAATAAGAVAGAAIGGSSGGGSLPYSRDVRRCENYASSQPTYWDVTYNFRGYDHHIQMSYAPGPTILVNGLGEPRQ